LDFAKKVFLWEFLRCWFDELSEHEGWITILSDSRTMRTDIETITEYGCGKWFDNSAMRSDGKRIKNFAEKQRISKKKMSEASI
jgi:hypothetical protein